MRTPATILISIIFFLQGVGSLKALGKGNTKKVNSRHYKFSIRIPKQMIKVEYGSSAAPDLLYYDTSAKIILMISARESKFVVPVFTTNCHVSEKPYIGPVSNQIIMIPRATINACVVPVNTVAK